MIKRYFIPAIIAVFALASCAKEIQDPGIQPESPIVSENVHSLSVGIESGAYVPEDGATKASMEAVIRVKWEKDDSVSVVNATQEKILGGCLKATESGENVVFSGTVEGTINMFYTTFIRGLPRMPARLISIRTATVSVWQARPMTV